MKNIWDKINSIKNKIAEQNKQPSHNNTTQNKQSSQTNPTLEISPKNYVDLPITKANHIPVPNIILRSSLFGLVEKGTRQIENKQIKSTLKGNTIIYSGEQLDQADFDVWLECLQRCQKTQLGNIVQFSLYDFLKSINHNNIGTSNRKWLKDAFLRLKCNQIKISDSQHTYTGSLIDRIDRDKETRKYCLVISPNIISCFSGNSWTGIEKEIRFKLKGKSLTLWLHAFYCTHNKPLPFNIKILKELCGSRDTLKDFKKTLKKALLKLSSVTQWQCFINEENKVIIKK